MRNLNGYKEDLGVQVEQRVYMVKPQHVGCVLVYYVNFTFNLITI